MLQVEIRVNGIVDRNWSGWVGDLDILHTSEGNTVLSGPVRDQAQLEGLLSQLFGLGLEIASFSSANKPPVH